MAYSEKLADRIRESLVDTPKVEEIKMFRGVTFMVDGKMCVSIGDEEVMCRIDPKLNEVLTAKKGCRTMTMKGREYKGFVLISEEVLKTKSDFDYWIGLALDFNKKAKVTAKKGRNEI
jgi:TfoX/Sxy family transcriptional regulator of competence genes